MGLVQQATELAHRAREGRNRYVDFLRVLAIVAVVIGHWIVIDVQLRDGLPVGVNALAQAPWIHWGTWVFQVIPLFFLVGGYANAVSWRAHRARGEDWASWLRRRFLRLLWPTSIFVAAGLLVAPAAAWGGLPGDILTQAAWAVAFILWFLAVYLVVAALTPATLRAHESWKAWFVFALIVAVMTTDALRFLGGVEVFAYLNYGFVWLAFHQIGYFWRDDRLPTLPVTITSTLSAGALLAALVVLGPYPVTMVGVPGAEIQNTGPPNLALLLLGLTQIGIVISLRSVMSRRLESSGLWTAVVSGNLVVMSVFLWHVVPVVILAAIFSFLGVTLPGEPGSLTWLAFRPPWILMLTVLLIPLVLLVRRGERPPEALEALVRRQGRSRLTLVLGLIGTGAVSAGLARLTLEGFWVGQPTLVPLWGALAFFGGATLTVGSGALAPVEQRGVT